MRSVIQRVCSASVTIDTVAIANIGQGLLVLIGIECDDTAQQAKKLAEKIVGLRIFEDEDGKLNRSAVELGLSAMVISNFTLYGDSRKGKRPSFIAAAKEPVSTDCYAEFISQMSQQGLKEVVTGEFGADMQVSLTNDGPITLMLDTEEWARKEA